MRKQLVKNTGKLKSLQLEDGRTKKTIYEIIKAVELYKRQLYDMEVSTPLIIKIIVVYFGN